MTSETPFRVPAAPKRLNRISPSRQFMQMHAKANTEASVATARGAVSWFIGLCMLGFTSYFLIPIILSHINESQDLGTCLCKIRMPAFALLISIVSTAWIFIFPAVIARPLRKKFKHLEGLISKVQDFNRSIGLVNFDIHKFEKRSYDAKLALIEKTMNLSGARENILAELEAIHD